MKTNFILYLNGVSSCGKSSISKELKSLLKEPTIYLALDDIHQNLCDEYNNDKWKLYDKEVFGLHRTAKVWYDMGFNVIVDNVLESTKLKKDALEVLPNSIFIGVFASLETLLQREEQRGRTHYKLIEFQFPRVHKNFKYELEYDSQKQSAREIAEDIVKTIINKG